MHFCIVVFYRNFKQILFSIWVLFLESAPEFPLFVLMSVLCLLCNDLLFCFSAEYDHVLSPEEQRKIAEAATEEVVIETNAVYGLRSEDQLQARQLTMETKLAYELRKESELPKNPTEQVTESDDYFNSDPLLEPVDTTGYASVPHRRSSSSSFS